MSSLSVALAAVATLISLTFPAVAAPVLVGNGTLNSANDLTVVQDGATTYEFLDLTTTYGQTVATAVAAYSAQGFRWADGAEVATLFAAFDITYGITPGGMYYPGANTANTANLASYLGRVPGSGYALGWIDDLFSGSFTTYACISTCSGDTFVNNTSTLPEPNPFIGTFLVRENLTAVPEPGTLALVCISLLGLAVGRKRNAG